MRLSNVRTQLQRLRRGSRRPTDVRLRYTRWRTITDVGDPPAAQLQRPCACPTSVHNADATPGTEAGCRRARRFGPGLRTVRSRANRRKPSAESGKSGGAWNLPEPTHKGESGQPSGCPRHVRVTGRQGDPDVLASAFAVEIPGRHQDPALRQPGDGVPAALPAWPRGRVRPRTRRCESLRPSDCPAATTAAGHTARVGPACASSRSAAVAAACTGSGTIIPACLRTASKRPCEVRVPTAKPNR